MVNKTINIGYLEVTHFSDGDLWLEKELIYGEGTDIIKLDSRDEVKQLRDFLNSLDLE